MTILTVFQEAATVIGMDVPTAVYASTEREHQELAVLANTMARRISRSYEWQELKQLATYTGDDTSVAFSLPSDFDGMPKKQSLWSPSILSPFTHVTDYDRWLEMITIQFSSLVNVWILIGNRILIRPAMAAGVTAQHYYRSNLIARPASGSDKYAFTSDSDSFVLDEELLRLGIVWQWKASKGHAYAEDMANYEDLLATQTDSNTGPKTIRIGPARIPAGTEMAFPGTVIA